MNEIFLVFVLSIFGLMNLSLFAYVFFIVNPLRNVGRI